MTAAAPVAGPDLMAREALTYPAVQLFVQRVAATVTEFELSDADASSAGDICRKLDGIPLALEFEKAGKIDVTVSVEKIGAMEHQHMNGM